MKFHKVIFNELPYLVLSSSWVNEMEYSCSRELKKKQKTLLDGLLLWVCVCAGAAPSKSDHQGHHFPKAAFLLSLSPAKYSTSLIYLLWLTNFILDGQ